MGAIDERIQKGLFGNPAIKQAEQFSQMQVGLNCTNPKDYSTYTVAVKAPIQFPLMGFLDQCPTPILYQLIEMIQKTLANRTDAKR